MNLRAHLLASLRAVALFTLVLGLGYPLIVTGVASVAFPNAAAGSPVERDGRIVGSARLGQAFDDPRYFWGRPSATPSRPYNAAVSSGSNLGPTNPALVERVTGDAARLRAAHGGAPIPVDLATASGSGLDPDLSPAAARYQVARVAASRGLTEEAVLALVERQVEGRFLGAFGEPRVNVLKLNLALDALDALDELAGAAR